MYTFKNLGDQYEFRELSSLILKIFSLPISNAVVERVFSAIKAVKSESRNKMNLNMFTAILRIRIHFYSRKLCCTSFEPTSKMFTKFTSAIYETPKPSLGGTSNEDEENILEETLTLLKSNIFNEDIGHECSILNVI